MPNGSGDDGDSPDRLNKVFLEVELRNLNSSLPRVRRPLRELLAEPSPSYMTASGEHVRFDREDLVSLSKIVPPDKAGEILLPFVIVKEASSRRGVYTFEGNDSEIAVLAALLKKDEPSRCLFRPDIYELGRLCPTVFVLGFSF